MNDDTTVTTTIQGLCLEDSDLMIKKVVKNKVDFTAVGRFNDINLKHWMKPMDIVDSIVSMSKPTQRFFQLLKYNRNGSTNMCDIRGNDMPQQVISKAYVELKKGSAVKRVKRDLYMINPKLILVYPDCRNNAAEVWKTL